MRLPPVPAVLVAAVLSLLIAVPSNANAEPRTPSPSPSLVDTRAAVLVQAVNAGGEPLAGAFEARLSAALVARGIDVTELAKRFPPPPPASLEQAAASFAEGQQAFDDLDPETARTKLMESASIYAQHPVETPTERLARVFIFLGANAMMEGKRDLALEAFRRAAVLAPGVEPESALFGTDVSEAYAEAQASLEARPTQTFTLSSSPSGARAFVGGRDLGITPLDGMPLPTGRHHVVLTRPGYLPYGEFTEVGEAEVSLRPILEPVPAYAEVLKVAATLTTKDAFAAPVMPDAARPLATTLDARFLVLARVGAADPASSADGAEAPVRAVVQVWDTKTGNRLSGLTVDLDDADWSDTMQLAEQVRAWIVAPPPSTRSVASLGFEPPPLLRKWWFWAAVGGTVAASAGVYAVAHAGPSSPSPFVLGVP